MKDMKNMKKAVSRMIDTLRALHELPGKNGSTKTLYKAGKMPYMQ